MSPDVEDDYLDRLERKAEFCLRTHVQPSEYDAMTDDEIDAFITVLNRIAEQ